MKDTHTIEISFSKPKLVKLLLFSVLFLIGGLWIMIAQLHTSNVFFNNPIVKNVAAYGSTLMGIFGIYYFSRRLVDKRPGMIIGKQGITDYSGALSIGLIAWDDVTIIYETTVPVSIASKQRFITIGLKDPTVYISKQKNAIKRKTMSLNSESYGSPVQISTNGLKIGYEELLQLMKERLTEYRIKN